MLTERSAGWSPRPNSTAMSGGAARSGFSPKAQPRRSRIPAGLVREIFVTEAAARRHGEWLHTQDVRSIW
ncbi:hypothetical protein I553_6724 [Mycobacterium xenopi 4042]|uniref:Uncharacterized protein n=1 Tax=Mycobacterium xenopi 4042 TaxID=1299334 RepID=X8DC27_MYCXE|nr:hypothetical protein I553_6724 [Mycobacterium xenopi 4042]